ncbi:MAG TPA: glutamate--tRNA ligase, partial [Patescibacteria group bacterium]
MSEVRTRFAPSPTGFLHIGGLRTALYNYLFAKKNKGKFVLRIEDTDRERYVKGSEKQIINSLLWADLNYDEGPRINNQGQLEPGDNQFGPYIQSKRLELYANFAEDLIDKGLAYRCYCSKQRLEDLRKKQMAARLAPKYDRYCLNNKPSGKKYVIRFKIPEEGTTGWRDLVHDKVKFDNKILEDFVMMKQDGLPTYNFANVIDDHLMKISDVIRGEEFLSSTPKHLLLYRALGWPTPQFAHIPLILGKNKAKLSKRDGDVAVDDYFKKGYLPDALINFVALLGWNPGTDQEILDREALIYKFSLKQINKSNAIFDLDKLDWMNGCYIRQRNPEDLTREAVPFLIKAKFLKITQKNGYINPKNKEVIYFDDLKKIIRLEQGRMKKLSELPELIDFVFVDKLKYDPSLLIWKKMTKKELREGLTIISQYLNTFPEKNFTAEKLDNKIKELIK